MEYGLCLLEIVDLRPGVLVLQQPGLEPDPLPVGPSHVQRLPGQRGEEGEGGGLTWRSHGPCSGSGKRHSQTRFG